MLWYFCSDHLTDPERGYKGIKKEGLDFVVEYFPWKRLPQEVFATIGGKEVAKLLRLKLGIGSEKQKTEAKNDKSVTTSQPAEKTVPNEEEKLGEELKVNPTETLPTSVEDAAVEMVDEARGVDESLQANTSNLKRTFSEHLLDRLYEPDIPMLFPHAKAWEIKRKFLAPHVSWVMLDK